MILWISIFSLAFIGFGVHSIWRRYVDGIQYEISRHESIIQFYDSRISAIMNEIGPDSSAVSSMRKSQEYHRNEIRKLSS